MKVSKDQLIFSMISYGQRSASLLALMQGHWGSENRAEKVR